MTKAEAKTRIEEIEKILLSSINKKLVEEGSYMTAAQYDELADKRDVLRSERRKLEQVR